MKTIGLLGGMSWESSLEYYRLINENTKKLVGVTHSCKSILYTFDFDYIERLQSSGRWDELTDEMVLQANNLKKAGADFLVICTNTMHMMAEDIEKRTGLRVLHIADAAAKEAEKQGLKKVALLGTNFTMTGDFYKDIFIKNYGINIIIPDEIDREFIHNTIYKELVLGQIKASSKAEFVKIIEKLVGQGAQGVVLGCTEIPLLIKQGDVSVPVLDTTSIHAKAAVEFANIE